MKEFLLNILEVDSETFKLIFLPLLIFFSRVADVSLATLRIVFVMNGKRFIAPILGFFEALIWLMAIGQIFQNVDSAISYLAYAGGYASGTFVGMFIEEKLAVGRVVVRVITQKPAQEVLNYLEQMSFRYTNLATMDQEGEDTNLLFAVVKRKRLPEFLNLIKTFHPRAYYTIEGVKKVSEEDIPAPSKTQALAQKLTLKRR
jgi:uncharacterized protein YebE (UPF0316 family)